MKYFIKKIISLIITLLVISLLTFTAFSIIPGDAALSKLGVDASPTAVENLRKEYGLDKPVIVRYGDWLADALHGDFGQSFKYSNKSVSELMASRLPVTCRSACFRHDFRADGPTRSSTSYRRC